MDVLISLAVIVFSVVGIVVICRIERLEKRVSEWEKKDES